MKIYVDDLRTAPPGYVIARSTVAALELIHAARESGEVIEILDLDHDAGDYACMGGDYIRILDRLEHIGCDFPIRLHTMNAVGRQNMMAIIERNKWKLVP